ncbi:hypothetical protein TWF696_008683 [Orbilia brochopaga]|uniref:Uncharacterized protein n=1 Tax=Orbilia brochopaga TaxID=3140254 RepID=A0AAV9UHM4_9PEZI
MEATTSWFDHLTIISEAFSSFTGASWSDAEGEGPDAEPTFLALAFEDPSDPKKPDPTEIPPRLDGERSQVGGEHMVSLPILKDSLKYYEKARRIYERNKEIRRELLEHNQPKQPAAPSKERENIFNIDDMGRRPSMLIQSEDKSDDEEENKPEEQEDQFLDFIGQILKNINNLLNEDNYHYDSNWKSMVRELDIDEGFFFLNIHKIHVGGELYEFLMTAGRHLGEYRLLETWRICTSTELTRFRETHFRKFEDFLKRINWSRLCSQIWREKKLLDLNSEETQEYCQSLLQRRTEPGSEKDEANPPPNKPYLPYIDDLIKATIDSDIQQDFFTDEIMALAQNDSYGGDMILHFLKTNNLEEIWFRLQGDLKRLGSIYQGRKDMTEFLRMRAILHRYVDVFFEVKENTGNENVESGYRIAEDGFSNAMEFLDILSLQDEEEKLRRMAEIFEYEVVRENGFLKLQVPTSDEDSDASDCQSDGGSSGKGGNKRDDHKTFVSEDSDQLTVIPARYVPGLG